MRIPSGKTDQSIYFVAVDATDLKTREVGLTGFAVYRSRNGGAPVAYTTPTVTELSAANMPGVYGLLVDEDTTLAASSDSEEYAVHITQASMAPVTRTVELYRRGVTTGNTLAVNGIGSVTLADGVAHGGTLGSSTATFALSRMNIVSQTVNTAGLTVIGNGVGNGGQFTSGNGAVGISHGLQLTCAAPSGDGLNTTGGTSLGTGITALGTGTGAGIEAIGGATNGPGIQAQGSSNGSGIVAVGVGTGSGINALCSGGVGPSINVPDDIVGNIIGTITTTTNLTVVSNIADAVWDEVVDGSRTARESVRLRNSGIAGKSSGLDTTTAVYRDLDDTKDRIIATVDEFGNRSAVVLDLT
jgi:hypothetical protein